nr:YeeE/YedE thiosulfate transporter family protein [uncultured Flavobacterium sp.]
MNIKSDKQHVYMNPYLGGFLLGIILILTFFFTGRGLGASGAAKAIVTQTVHTVAPTHSDNNTYYADQFLGGKIPISNWLVFEVIGVLAGAFISGSLSGRVFFRVQHSPKITARKRLWFALLGGTLFGFGAQFAKGCTSGAALSGMTVLSLGGYIAMLSIFGGAFLFAYFFRKLWL